MEQMKFTGQSEKQIMCKTRCTNTTPEETRVVSTGWLITTCSGGYIGATPKDHGWKPIVNRNH